MIYFVTFELHQNCQIKYMIFHCEAKNAKEAKETAKEFWSIIHGMKAHQFHLYAHKSVVPDVDLLRVIDWKGIEHKGQSVMNNVFCTDFRTWRVNGINKYGTKAGQHYRT